MSDRSAPPAMFHDFEWVARGDLCYELNLQDEYLPGLEINISTFRKHAGSCDRMAKEPVVGVEQEPLSRYGNCLITPHEDHNRSVVPRGYLISHSSSL